MPVMNDYEATAAIRSLLGAWDKQTGNIERGFCYDRIKYIFPKQLQSVAALAFISRADRSASYPDCNGTYEEQKTEKYVGRTDGGKMAFG